MGRFNYLFSGGGSNDVPQPQVLNKISLFNRHKMETITISKEEYLHLKQLEKLDFDLIRQFASSFEDLKQGRFKRLA